MMTRGRLSLPRNEFIQHTLYFHPDLRDLSIDITLTCGFNSRASTDTSLTFCQFHPHLVDETFIFPLALIILVCFCFWKGL